MADGGLPNFTEKVGPLPLWGWAAAIAGGYFVFKKLNPTVSTADNTLPTPNAADAALANSLVPDTSNPNGGGSDPNPTPGAPTTNAAWAIAAVTALIGQHADPVAAENAINKYLAGASLTTAEHALVSAALHAVGPPPEGVPISSPAPVQPPTSPPGGGGKVVPLPPHTFTLPNEYVVGQLVPPNGKGTWYLSNYGGVAAVGGAPFYGSAFTRGVHAPLPPAPASWRWSAIRNFGRGGYQIMSTRGDVQTFGS